MVTANTQYAIAYSDNELIMNLRSRQFAILAVALGLAAPVLAQTAAATTDGTAGSRPLNLSLPREAVYPSGTIIRQDPTLRDNLRAPSRSDEAAEKDDSERRGGKLDGAAAAPYGTGFEARQRGFGGHGQGGGSTGGGFGGGRGAGRGR